jgi:hypothetical protein
VRRNSSSVVDGSTPAASYLWPFTATTTVPAAGAASPISLSIYLSLPKSSQSKPVTDHLVPSSPGRSAPVECAEEKRTEQKRRYYGAREACTEHSRPPPAIVYTARKCECERVFFFPAVESPGDGES